ncbi:peptidase inhibitor family I36 protein [Uniformispora flossi]|uniref:peptidase inhibitor family I36 protein n=1 Tax=Uniformispora flossi TaxID=3390723 RepID=UPI003C2E616B
MKKAFRIGSVLTALTATGLLISGTTEASAATADGSEAQASCYVKVYQLTNFGGKSACITGDMKDLASYSWPAGGKIDNSISSMKLDKICTVDLYQYANYTGAHSHWTHSKPLPGYWTNDTTLANNNVGDNRTSSIKINCFAEV